MKTRQAKVVLSDTKIQIWKQFTTPGQLPISCVPLYYPIQRYKFESNSQPARRRGHAWSGCIIRYKDTNLKAIHNSYCSWHFNHKLYYPIQRYKFESNSQPSFVDIVPSSGCIIRYKDTNLKAIHNKGLALIAALKVVLSDTKIQIWKQFTTFPPYVKLYPLLYYPIQRYKFESNSQRSSIDFISSDGCIIRYKDTNLKAIHNSICSHCLWMRLYYPIQRYKFESNSQLSASSPSSPSGCIIRYKDTNLKAIHNVVALNPKLFALYYPIQRYKFESNSQQFNRACLLCPGCIIRYKDTNLKAIHNNLLVVDAVLMLYYPIQRYKFESNSQLNAKPTDALDVVLSDTKIQIWKQFTTVHRLQKHWASLYYPIQRYKFESNSQHRSK